jgi:hypothetical protein
MTMSIGQLIRWLRTMRHVGRVGTVKVKIALEAPPPRVKQHQTSQQNGDGEHRNDKQS